LDVGIIFLKRLILSFRTRKSYIWISALNRDFYSYPATTFCRIV